jgi:hypothetical protein
MNHFPKTTLKHFTKPMLLGLGSVLLIFVMSPKPSTGGPAVTGNVTIANTPLPVQGTVGVNNFPASQAVTGNVNANITNASVPVSGTVAVSSLPAINLGGAVSVGNTSGNPLFTTAADNPALQPFQFFQAGNAISFSFTVPVNKTLVIDYLSVGCTQTSGAVVDVELLANSGFGPSPAYVFAPTLVGSSEFVVSQQVRIYAGSGSEVLIGSTSQPPSSSSCSAAVAGHLVSPLP